MSILQIRGLSKAYGKKKAVDCLDLTIQAGEIFAFIGQNGAGKTTTIKSICGILQFDEGEILIDGEDIRKNPISCKRKMAYLPDNPDLYEFMTGVSYLQFIADVFRLPAATRKSRIEKYAAAFALTDDLAQPISAYSHGMKQKLALISAFIREPRLLLLDEPFVGLDPKCSRTLKDLMGEMCQNGGAIFFSTHVLDVAEKLCDKVAIIQDGRLLCQGKMDEIRGNRSLEHAFLELTEDRHV